MIQDVRQALQTIAQCRRALISKLPRSPAADFQIQDGGRETRVESILFIFSVFYL